MSIRLQQSMDMQNMLHYIPKTIQYCKWYLFKLYHTIYSLHLTITQYIRYTAIHAYNQMSWAKLSSQTVHWQKVQNVSSLLGMCLDTNNFINCFALQNSSLKDISVFLFHQVNKLLKNTLQVGGNQSQNLPVCQEP